MSVEVFSSVGIPLAFFFLLDFLVVLISGVLNRRSYQKFAFEYRRFYLKLEDIENKMNSIALPLLTNRD